MAFGLTFVLIGIVLFIIARKEPKCKSQNYWNEQEFHGVVTAKFLDPNQHSIPVVVIRTLNCDAARKIDFFLEKTNSYDKINVNDTILKTNNSDSLYVIKNNVKTLLQKVEFECQN